MTAAIFAKTWTNKASAQKAFSRAALDKAGFYIDEFAEGWKIKQRPGYHPEGLPGAAEPAIDEAPMPLHIQYPTEDGVYLTNAQAEAPVKIIEPAPTMTPDEALAKLRRPRPENATALPTPPDFSKPSHAPYRKRLAAMVAMAEAGDDVGLAALQFKVERSSQKIMARYRDACLKALGA